MNTERESPTLRTGAEMRAGDQAAARQDQPTAPEGTKTEDTGAEKRAPGPAEKPSQTPNQEQDGAGPHGTRL